MNKYTAIIPAAGIGSRMQSELPKQYLEINGMAMLEHTLRVFINSPIIEQVVVVIHPGDNYFNKLPVANAENLHIVTGGTERADSVLAGVEYAHTKLESEWVLVHDAARPGLSQLLLQKLITEVASSSGGILAMKAVDTVKQEYDGNIDKTLDRNRLWLAQTPQMFPTKILLNALLEAKRNSLIVTDEASAVEMQGIDIKLIEGDKANFKVTTPDDLRLAEYYLAKGDLS